MLVVPKFKSAELMERMAKMGMVEAITLALNQIGARLPGGGAALGEPSMEIQLPIARGPRVCRRHSRRQLIQQSSCQARSTGLRADLCL